MISLRGKILSFLSGTFFAVLVVLGYQHWTESDAGFPKIPDGLYLGKILWGDTEHEELFIMKTKGNSYTISYGELEGQEGSFVVDDRDATQYYPVQLPFDGYAFVFKGNPEADIPSGTVQNTESYEEGDWQLIPIKAYTPEEKEEPSEDYEEKERQRKLQIALLQELYDLEVREHTRRKDKEEQLALIETLKERLEHRDVLQSEASEQYRVAEESLKSLQTKQQGYLKQLQEYVRQLELARKTTKYGEVMRLARQAAHADEQLFLLQEGYITTDELR